MHFDSSTSGNIVEDGAYNEPIGVTDPNPAIVAGMLTGMTSYGPAQSNLLGVKTHRQIMVEFPALSLLQQGEHMNITHTDPIATQPSASETFPIGNTEFDERFVNGDGAIISASSLAALLASRFGTSSTLKEIEPPPSIYPLEFSKNSISNDNHHEAFNPAFAASGNGEYCGILGEMNNKWGPEKLGYHPFQLGEIINQDQWISSDVANISSDKLCGSSKYDKALSLSLATCQPPLVSGTVIPDQCSEISSSIVSHNSLNETRLGCKTSFNNKNPSHGHVPIYQFSSGSRYLRVIQEILAQIASYSLENVDQVNYPATLMRSSLSPSCLSERDSVINYGGAQGREVEAKKKQLVALLQLVDERHNQCLDEIHTVISAFHAATELDPRIHARFVLQTVSALYKNLRERISNQILMMGANSNDGGSREDDRSFETRFIQKQWALQQLRKKDHQLWRPQRGLPERSVSVLRAWMFQNFLHPYPKDAEKHLLAVKSGLTRSQVSNWFINARVRLWKPMIEEMYAEMNRRKGRRNDEGTNRATITGRRFDA